MIDVRNYRSNGGKEILLTNPLRTLEEAAKQILVYELGYGGKITKASEALIEIETLIFSCQDRTVFTGPVEEMKQLLAVIIAWLLAEKKVGFDEWWKRVSAITEGVPLYIKMIGPVIRMEMIMEEIMKCRT